MDEYLYKRLKEHITLLEAQSNINAINNTYDHQLELTLGLLLEIESSCSANGSYDDGYERGYEEARAEYENGLDEDEIKEDIKQKLIYFIEKL